MAGFTTPTGDSHVNFEVWVPESGWNLKYLQVGCGGFCGSVSYTSMGEPLRRGYAVAATDDGHQASGVDASWAVGHPQKVIERRMTTGLRVSERPITQGVIRFPSIVASVR